MIATLIPRPRWKGSYGSPLRRLRRSAALFTLLILFPALTVAEYAKTLTKSAHLSVEGELRSREKTNKKTNAKQRVWEVRVSSRLKVDRAEKVSPEEQEPEEINPEEEAA
jgi:hypothetical protein